MSYPPLAGSSPCRNRCVCDSIIPGSTVALDKSMTFAPAGALTVPSSPTASIFVPRTTMTWLCFGVSVRGSISVPARMTVTCDGFAGVLCPTAPTHNTKTMQTSCLNFIASFRPLFSLHFRSNNRIRFDLHQHLWRDHGDHLQHRRCRADIAEHLAVRPRYFFPAAHVGDEHSRPHHVAQAPPRSRQSPLDVLQRLHRLGVHVVTTND